MGRSFKVLAIHKQMYPGTYNFRDEAVGTEGLDIDFVDFARLHDGACEIVSDWQGHKKVLRLQDDATAAEDPLIYHNETQATSGTREFYIGTNDVTEYWEFYFYEAGHNYIIRLRISGAPVAYLDYCDRGELWQEVQAVSSDVLYHVKVIWRADNTFDVWVNEILKVDNVLTNHIMVSGINQFRITCIGDSTDYIYLDAYGDVDNDANYNVGDNCFWRHYKESDDSFELDDVGLTGTSITWVDAVDTAASTVLVSEFNEHKKILRQGYTSAVGGFDYCSHVFDSQSKNCWVAFWLKTTNILGTNNFRFHDDNDDLLLEFAIRSSKFQTYYGAAWNDLPGAPTPAINTWYLIFLEFRDDDKFDSWVNNVKYDNDQDLENVFTDGLSYVVNRQNQPGYFSYIDAFSSSLDSETPEKGDNRLFDYNATYTSEDVTSEVENVITTNRLGKWREGVLTSKETYKNSEIFVQVYDVNDKLAMEADLKKRNQVGDTYTYPLRDKNQDDLENESSNAFTADDIHDPTDSTSMLKVILPNVGEEDGDLILVEADAKTDTYSPTTINYPDYMMLTDIGDLADSVVIIHANGKCYLDDDKASGTALDFDTEADHDKMSGVILVTDILETINYFVIKGDFNPDTGTRFVKVIDNVGSDKKRSWRYTNNNFKSQADVNNYAAAIENRIATIKIIKVVVQSVGSHNMGETMDYKYVDAVYNVPQANYYIIYEEINFNENENIIILSEGMIEESKYAAGYEKPEDYTDSYASGIYATDLITIIPLLVPTLGASEDSNHFIALNAVGERCICNFYTSDKIDTEREMKIEIVYKCDGGGAFAMKRVAYRYDVDGSDVPGTLIWDDIEFNFVGGDDMTHNNHMLTLSSSDLVADSWFILSLELNVAARLLMIEQIQYKYYQKRVAT